MKRLLVLGVGSLLAFAPSMASAALRVVLPDRNTIGNQLNPGLNTYDVFVTGTDAEDEQLFAYGLGLVLTKVSGVTPGGVSFVAPFAERPSENFVFSSSNFTVGTSSANRVELDAENTAASFVNVPQGTEVRIARLTLNVDATALAQEYRITLDPNRTGFGSGDPNRADPILTTDVSDTGILQVVPEPASASLLVLGGLLALRRRRTA